MEYDLADTSLKLGRRFIDVPASSSTVLQYAVIAVGRFGNADDVERLERHLSNTTVCHNWSNPQLKKNGPIQIQVRDIVLAMLVRVTGQDPQDYGFKLLQDDPVTIYRMYSFGFVENKERDAALAKWKAWRAGQKADS